jgi:ATP-dependent protease ClpP protease subunit
VAREDQLRQADPDRPPEGAGGQVSGVRDDQGRHDEPLTGPESFPVQSPLFHAEHADRYQRQEWIRRYQDLYRCRLIAVVDVLFGQTVTFVEELIYDASPDQDLHMILVSPGGDGEVALRLVRSLQARCNELTVILPDIAKSAGTILVMGAHHILMAPTSDLGPVDPQFQIGGQQGLVSAKDIIAAVENAEKAVASSPDTYPIHAALLSDLTALQVEQARSALARTGDLVTEALKSLPGRSETEVSELKVKLHKALVDVPRDHSAVFSAQDAKDAGLPVEIADPRSDQWRLVWRLYAKYFMMGAGPGFGMYEGANASRTVQYGGPPTPPP